MPIETVPGCDVQYFLLAYDANCREQEAGFNDQLSEMLAQNPISDVFLFSHGWQGDVPAAREQYTRWITAMVQPDAEIQRVRQQRHGFNPLLIGLHWPSLPWGDEELGVAAAATAASPPGPLGRQIDDYVQRIADTPRGRDAVRTILAAANGGADQKSVSDACRMLNEEAGLGGAGIGAAPGSDREPLEPQQVVLGLESSPVAARAFDGDTILTLLRTLSFWKMKARAHQFGETVGIDLLVRLPAIAAGRDVRFHLMGHSFGCIVASAMLNKTAVQAVHSLALVQGALSLWSYCADIPYPPRGPGDFRGIAANRRVSGAIVTTQSEHDRAVGRWYPLAAQARGQVCYAPAGGPGLPKYGAVGTFGLKGDGLDIVDIPMLPTSDSYGFRADGVYNIDASQFICQGGGFSGAHSDICHPEVAHMIWEAVLA